MACSRLRLYLLCVPAPRIPATQTQHMSYPEPSAHGITHLVIKQSRRTRWRQAAPVVLQAPDDACRALQPMQSVRQAAETGCPPRQPLAHVWGLS